MLAIEAPRVGQTYHWLIADLMTRRSGDVSQWTRGEDWAERWDRKLEEKRNDDHYDEVVESIQMRGFIRPLDATRHFYYNEDAETDGMVHLADGHHRFAAAIDLGMEAVPVYVSEYPTIAPDSGDWRMSTPVSTRAGIGRRDAPSDYSGVAW